MSVDKFGRFVKKNIIGLTEEEINSKYLRKDGINTATGPLNMNNNRISNVIDPIDNQDAATKHYVDTNGSGFSGDMEGNYITGLPTVYPSYGGNDSAVSWRQAIDLIVDSVTNIVDPTDPGNVVNLGYANNNYIRKNVDIDMEGKRIQNISFTPTNTSDVVSAAYVNQGDIDVRHDAVLRNGTQTMTGNLNMDGRHINNLVDPTDAHDAATKNYVDTNSVFNGDMQNKPIINTTDPTNAQDVTTKNYVDDLIPPTYDGDEVPILFLFGQSNMDGKGKLSDVPGLDVTFNGEVKIWNKPLTRNPSSISVNHTDDGVWKNYAIGDMITSPSGTNPFGPELQVARLWRDKYYARLKNKPLYIVKCAIGGASLHENNNVDQSWHDGLNSIRDLAVNYFSIPAIRQLQLQNLKPKCIGLVWGQGESDATPSESTAYQTNLTNLITDLTTQIGFPDAKIIVMGLSAACDDSTHWIAVKQAQADYVLSNANSTLITTDGKFEALGDLTIQIASPIARYLDNIGAGPMHYSSSGLITLGNKYFDSLNLNGTKYVENWDFTLIGLRDGEEVLVNNQIDIEDTYGSLNFLQYPTSTGTNNAVTWVRSGETRARPSITASPMSEFLILDLTKTSSPSAPFQNVEVIFRMIHDGDLNTKLGILLRSSGFPGVDSGVLIQVREGGGQLAMFERDGRWKKMSGSPTIPSQLPRYSNPYWYRVTLIDLELNVYNSPNGKIWTQQYRGNLARGAVSGQTRFTLYNGKCDKVMGDQRIAHCAFDVILARHLM